MSPETGIAEPAAAPLETRQVTDPLAKSMVRRLAGLKGFPTTREACMRLVEVICDHSVGVSHAHYVIDAFDEYCPTPRALTDALREPSVRERFGKREPSQREQWAAECGAPDPEGTASMVRELESKLSDSDQRKADEREMWRKVRERLKVPKSEPDLHRFSWGDIYRAMHALGYRLNQEQREMAGVS